MPRSPSASSMPGSPVSCDCEVTQPLSVATQRAPRTRIAPDIRSGLSLRLRRSPSPRYDCVRGRVATGYTSNRSPFERESWR
jgi:hypothetical protein